MFSSERKLFKILQPDLLRATFVKAYVSQYFYWYEDNTLIIAQMWILAATQRSGLR